MIFENAVICKSQVEVFDGKRITGLFIQPENESPAKRQWVVFDGQQNPQWNKLRVGECFNFDAIDIGDEGGNVMGLIDVQPATEPTKDIVVLEGRNIPGVDYSIYMKVAVEGQVYMTSEHILPGNSICSNYEESQFKKAVEKRQTEVDTGIPAEFPGSKKPSIKRAAERISFACHVVDTGKNPEVVFEDMSSQISTLQRMDIENAKKYGNESANELSL